MSVMKCLFTVSVAFSRPTLPSRELCHRIAIYARGRPTAVTAENILRNCGENGVRVEWRLRISPSAVIARCTS